MENQKFSAIKGDDVFFNFIEIDYNDTQLENDIISKIHNWDLQGVVVKNVFSEDEVDEIINNMDLIPENLILNTYTGSSFPDPFATITDNKEKLDNYINKTDVFLNLPFDNLLNRLKDFFNRIEKKMKPVIPLILNKNKSASPGNFRVIPSDKDGLFVHCGYLFQKESPFYYSVVNDMEKNGQLSYFIVLQNSDEGGALTIFDMLWKDVYEKDSFTENKYVIKPSGEKLYLKDVKQFSVKPNAGDIVVFSGGPIWHRVEPVVGKSRITFGGFINFSKDNKEYYYWS